LLKAIKQRIKPKRDKEYGKTYEEWLKEYREWKRKSDKYRKQYEWDYRTGKMPRSVYEMFKRNFQSWERFYKQKLKETKP